MFLTDTQRKKLFWFEKGADALRRILPDAPQGYVCPLCLRLFPSEALAAGLLTFEHVPPKQLDGRPLVLTCKTCNSHAGHLLDAEMNALENVVDFVRGEMKEFRSIQFTVGSHNLNAQVRSTKTAITVLSVPRSNNPYVHQAVLAEFERLASGILVPDMGFKIHLNGDKVSFRRAQVGWLRAGYLAAFAVLGYSYILHPCMAPLRKQFANPTKVIIPKFYMRIPYADTRARRILIVREPQVFRGIAVQVGRQMVFLPRLGDSALYDRLGTEPARNILLEGVLSRWPEGPSFGLDFASSRTEPS